jgi:putative ABC transport system ATP-binding protein
MSDEPRELISACDLGRRREEGGWLIRDVELTLRGGDRVAVVGPTGSGKSVLLRALGCLDAIDQGNLCWRGRAIADAEVPPYRANVVYLHQRAAMFDGTVQDNLRLPFSLRVHKGKPFDRDWAVAQLGLLDRPATFLEKDVRDLSGGEAQIVALTRALGLAPTVLLLDEPTAALDAVTTSQLETLVERWLAATDGARAFIWVTHEEAQADRVATVVWRMQDGHLDIPPSESINTAHQRTNTNR